MWSEQTRGRQRQQKDREIKSEREMFYGFQVIITQTGRGKTSLIHRCLYLIWQNCIQGHDGKVGTESSRLNFHLQVNIHCVSLAKWLLTLNLPAEREKTKRQAEIERKTKKLMNVNDPDGL